MLGGIITQMLLAQGRDVCILVRHNSPSEAMAAQGMAYTILSPNLFAEVWVGVVVGAPLQAGQPITLVGEARRKHSFVSLADVAAFAVAALDNPAAINATIPIGGPEAVSWRDVVTGVEQVVGQELPVRFVQPGEPVPFVPEAVQQSMAIQDTYDSPIPMAETAATYGVTLTPMATVLQRMFGAG